MGSETGQRSYINPGRRGADAEPDNRAGPTEDTQPCRVEFQKSYGGLNERTLAGYDRVLAKRRRRESAKCP